MQFLYPQFLWALAVIAIPVIIHLFNFRRYKKYVFSSISFIKNATIVNKKQQTIKNWLVLVCRVLALSFLVFAFAQPYLPLNKNQKKFANKIVSVYVDNSFSMSNVSKNGELLEIAKNKARELAKIYGNTSQYQLLTNSFEGRQQQLVNKDVYLKMVDEIALSADSKLLNQVVSRQNQLISQFNNTQKNSFIISDFQSSFYNPETTKFDSAVKYNFVTLKNSVQNNVLIDTAYVNAPFIQTQNPVVVHVVIKNFGNTPIENQPLILKINGVQKALQNYSVEPNKSIKLDLPLTLTDTLPTQAVLSITDYPITYDDVYYLTLKATASVNVLLLNQHNNLNAITKVYGIDKFYKLNTQNLKQINYAAFATSHLIIVNEPEEISSGLATELEKFVTNGGNLLVIPPSTEVPITLNNFLVKNTGINLGNGLNQNFTISEIETRDALFKDVFTNIPKETDWPKITQCKQIAIGSKSTTKPLLKLNNGWYYLTKTNLNKGNIFVLASSLSTKQTNLTQHALFVPLMLNMPLVSNVNQLNASYNSNNAAFIKINGDIKNTSLIVKNSESEFTTNAVMRSGNWYANLNNQITKDGFYSIYANKQLIDMFAINYNRQESGLKYAEPANLQSNMEEITEPLNIFEAKLKLNDNGKQYWFWALLLVLCFVISEVLILKFVK